MAHVVALRSLAVGVNILTSLLTAAMLGPGGRGEQAALVLAPTFLGGVFSCGLHASLIYNMKADPARQRELLGTGILLACGMGLLGALAGAIAEPYWLSQYSPHSIAVGRLLLLATPLIVVQWSLTAAAEVQGWFGLANRMLSVQSMSTLACLGLLIWLRRLTPVTSALAYILPMLPSFCYILAVLLARLRPVLRFDPRGAKRLLRFALRFCGVDLLSTLSGSADQLVIVAFLPPRTVGTYVVAVSSARLLTVVQGAISSVLFPSVAAGGSARVAGTVAETFRIATLLLSALALGLGCAGPALLLLAYGPRFAGCVAPFRILLLAMLAENGARILYQIYAGSGRPGIVSIFEIAAVGTSLALMLLLVPPFGTGGAACAVLGASCLRLALAASGLRRVLGGHRRPLLLPGPGDLRAIRAGLARARRPLASGA